MGSRFASGKWAISTCDQCGFEYKLKELKALIIKTKVTDILVCPACWVPDQPQLQIGMYPVFDPQALRDPRPDTSYWQSGYTGLQVHTTNPNNHSQLAFGYPGEGSRQIQWGWNPVGLHDPLGLSGLSNTLEAVGAVGTVTVTTS